MPAAGEQILSSRRGQILVALVTTSILVPLMLGLAPEDGVRLAIFSMLPLMIVAGFNIIVVGFNEPFGLCLLFVVFSFFRIHEAFPILYPMRIPLLLAVLTLAVLAWHVFITRKIKPALNAKEAQAALTNILAPLWRVMPSPALYTRALALQERYRFAFLRQPDCCRRAGSRLHAAAH